MSVPNLKRIALFVQKLLGSQNFEIGSRDLGHAHLGVVLSSARRGSQNFEIWSRNLCMSVIMLLCTKFRVNQTISRPDIPSRKKRFSLWRPSAMLNLQNCGTLSCERPWKRNLCMLIVKLFSVSSLLYLFIYLLVISPML